SWQFGDYAYAHSRWMEGDEARAQVEFWRQRLAGSPPVLTLPHDRPRPAEQRFRGAGPRHELSAALYDRLREASRRAGVTLFATMLAAYDVLLWRWSGQADLNIGTGIANRRAGETHELMGMFVNSVVVRTRVDPALPFAELARRVHAEALAAAENQEIPFETVVEALRPGRSLGHNPLYQAMFSFHDSPVPEMRLPGVEMEAEVGLSNGSSKFDLDVVAIPRAEQRVGLGRTGEADGITLIWEHNTDLFDAATMEAMFRQYRTLLEAVAADPERRVGSLELLDRADRRRVLAEWNPAPAAGAETPVHRRVEAQAARMPDAAAIVHGGTRISYGELNRRANRLAHYLREVGVGPDVRVALCLERSAELTIAVLAVLKAGGAYVPLDPAYPPGRLEMMLADSGAAVLVTQARTRSAAVPPLSVGVVDLDEARAEIELARDADPEGGAGPENLAYVVYTSGSTGIPKGVGIEHRALAAYVDGAIQAYGLGAGDRLLQFHSISFDPAAEEIFATLGSGAALVPLADALAEPGAFWETCRREGVTILDLPTAVWHTLVPHVEGDPDALPATLRLAVIGGERALPEAVAAWRRASGGRVRLLNSYGPTETTIGATLWEAPADADAPVVLIGRPMPGCRAYVLDEAMRPLPPGVPGELFVGGEQVARGYLGRAGTTAERFVPDAFSSVPGARAYRTGDRARWRADGTLEYMGRLDAQVKVRGYRVEPGEVEAVLRAHPGVAGCAVVPRDGAGGVQLVGYAVPREGAAATADELRAHLRRHLPEHMVPGALVLLDALPLTPNGKVDRDALPEPWGEASSEDQVAPRTPVEEVLAAIWGEVLGRERVGANENFFALGGHSLLATRVISRIRAALGAEVPVRALFEAPTVAELAARIEAGRRDGAAPLQPVVPVPRDGPLPLSFAQERLWFLHRMDPASAAYSMRTALRLSGALEVPALERALGEVVRRHEALRTTFAEVEGAAVQVIHPFAGFALPVHDLSALPEGEREAEALRRAAAEGARPFDLVAEPPFRASLLRLGEDDHRLLITLHHIASDGWSTGVLARELSALYAAYRDGRESPLADLPVQVADDAAWQREQLRGDALARPLAWWRERLAGAPALLELPTDRPRPARVSFRGRSLHLRLDPALSAAADAFSRRRGVTLYMTLLAAYHAQLHLYSGEEDIIVGGVTDLRRRPELEHVVGYFLNT
ncbi:MAG: amino acid adenylation domain-containing protein, partial [Gemmatimonadetes bacterium]|nr:amino acid adenylation domain-containing protein [Gemmatimonadota bacterium]